LISVAQHQGVPPELRGLLAFKNTDQAQITRHQRDMNWVRTYADRFDWFAGSLLLLDEFVPEAEVDVTDGILSCFVIRHGADELLN